jgi:hypothetical protein
VIRDPRVPDVARVVDQDVEVAQARDAGADDAIAEVLLGHVACEGLAGPAGADHVGLERSEGLGIEIVGEHSGTSETSFSAIERPMPRAAAVTIATRPSSLRVLIDFPVSTLRFLRS